MALAGAQIRAAIATRLTGLPLAGERVYKSRAWPLNLLPAWKIVTPDEDIEPMTVHPNTPQNHRLQLELQGYTSVVDELDDRLDDLAAEALTAIFNPPGSPDALSVLMTHMQLTQRRIERVMSPEGQAVLGMVQITLRAEYRTKANAPETIL